MFILFILFYFSFNQIKIIDRRTKDLESLTEEVDSGEIAKKYSEILKTLKNKTKKDFISIDESNNLIHKQYAEVLGEILI